MKKRILLILIALIVICCSYITYRFVQFQSFGKYVQSANQCMNSEQYEKAIEFYNEALKHKDDASIRADIVLAQKLIVSQNDYLAAQKQINEQKYGEAIESLKKVCKEDKKRYIDAQVKIIECYCYNNNVNEAEKYIKAIKSSLSENELKPVMQIFYVKKGDLTFNNNENGAIGIYQTAAKYGYDLSKSVNYSTTIFSLATSIFNVDHSGPGQPKTYLCNFDGKKLYDNVMITSNPGGSGIITDCCIYKFDGTKYTVLFDNKLPVENYFDFKLSDNYKVVFSSKYFSKKYLVDIKGDTFIKNNGRYYVGDGQGPVWKSVDIDNDGINELDCIIYADGNCHADRIADVHAYFKYDSNKNNWSIKDYEVKEDGYPVQQVDENSLPAVKVKSKDQALELIKSKVSLDDFNKTHFYSEIIIPKGYNPPEKIIGKMCYNFIESSSGNEEICEYFVIESTGQVYRGVQGSWTLMN